MATITLRSIVGRALTTAEIDANFDNLNTSKAEATNAVFTGLVTLPSQNIACTDTGVSDIAPSLNLDFANSKALDPRITFDRNSIGTYYDGQTTVKAEENLLPYSTGVGNFSSGWPPAWGTSGGGTVVDNIVAAPNNTTTASQVTTLSNTLILLTTGPTTYAGLPYTISLWVQLVSGTGTFTMGGATSPIKTATNVWQQFSWTFTPATTANYLIFLLFNNPNSVINIWGAQLEQRSAATAYIPAPVSNYIPVLLSAPLNTPRFDHDSRPAFYGTCTVSGSAVTLPATFADGSSPSSMNSFYTGSIIISGTSYVITGYVGSTRIITVTGSPTAGVFSLINKNYGQSLGLLIEEQRTNLLTYSSDFTQGTTIVNITIVPNATIAPDGTLTAQHMTTTNTFSGHGISKASSSNTAGTYTASIYAKIGAFRYVTFGMTFDNNSNRYAAIFDLLNIASSTVGNGVQGTATNGSFSTVAVGNGWYRLIVTATISAMTTGAGMRIWQISNVVANETTPTQGDGYSGFYLWGAQLEAGAFATSYIPTTSSTATRLADSAKMTGTNFSSWFNQSEGTLCAEFTPSAMNINTGFWALSGLSASNSIDSRKQNSHNVVYTPNGSSQQATYPVNITAWNQYKEGVMYSQSSWGVCSMGIPMTTVTSLAPPPGNIITLYIGQVPAGLWTMNGHFNKLSYYPKALTSTQLKGLTKL